MIFLFPPKMVNCRMKKLSRDQNEGGETMEENAEML